MKSEKLYAYVNQELTPAEEEQLEKELRTNAELRRLFSELCIHDFIVAEAYQSGAIKPRLSEPSLPKLKQKSPNFNQSPKSPLSQTSWGLIAASVLLFIGLSIYTSVGFKETVPSNRVVSRIVKAGPNVRIAQVDKKITVTGPIDIHEQDRILVPEGSFALIKYSDGSLIKLRDRTLLQLKGGAGGKHALLTTGKLSAKIAPQPKDKIMTFSTPHGEIDIVGTEFDIHAHIQRGTYVHLFQGKVSFRNYNDNSVIQLNNSEWAMIAPNTSFTPYLGNAYRYKDGETLRASKQAEWITVNTTTQTTLDAAGTALTKISLQSSERGTASINLPSLSQLSAKAIVIEFECRTDEPGTELGRRIIATTPPNKMLNPDPRLLQLYKTVSTAKLGKWIRNRYEVAYGSKEFPGWFHMNLFENGRLVISQWEEGTPDQFQILLTHGNILVRNVRVLELVEDPIESK